MPSGESSLAASVTTARIVTIIPRPGQPGAPYFDKTKVTEFLEDWEMLCVDYGLSDADRVP